MQNINLNVNYVFSTSRLLSPRPHFGEKDFFVPHVMCVRAKINTDEV